MHVDMEVDNFRGCAYTSLQNENSGFDYIVVTTRCS